MDWITFIKWNGIVYATYYGANLLVDYLQTKRELTPNTNYTQYNLKDLGIEKPQVVQSSDFLPKNERTETSSPEKKGEEKNGQSNQVSFGAPLERQGIPLKEYIKTSHLFSTKIFKPTT